MAPYCYTKESLLRAALKAIEDEVIIKPTDLPAYMPCSWDTIKKYFPEGSAEWEQIRQAIFRERTRRKRRMIYTWTDPEAPSQLQLAGYKLLALDEPDELAALGVGGRGDAATAEQAELSATIVVEVVQPEGGAPPMAEEEKQIDLNPDTRYV